MANFIVHQTFENRGNAEEVISKGGIYADETHLFLGKGFYYWESNSDKAYEWGIKHYKGNYFTFEAIIDLDLNLLLDLTYRYYIDLMLRMIRKYAQANKISKSMKIGAFIDFIRHLQKLEQDEFHTSDDELPFPFLYARAVDHSNSPKDVKDRMEFTDRFGVSNYFLSKPCSFFCVYSDINLHLSNKRLLRERPVKPKD